MSNLRVRGCSNEENERRAKIVIISEIFFVLLPVIVIGLVLWFQSKAYSFMIHSEWSFAAIILFGQTIVKLASGVSKGGKRKKWQVIALIITCIIVFGLIPSVIIQVILLAKNGMSNGHAVNNVIYVIQAVMFGLSVLTYYCFGTLGQVLLDEEGSEKLSQNSRSPSQ